MPKSLKEIKHFHSGTVLNSSEQDISDDTTAFSLNVNPMSEGGILDAIKNDRIAISSDNTILRALYPISWGASEQYAGTDVYNDTRTIFNDINMLDNTKSIFDFIFFGSKGRKEILKAKTVRPWVERVKTNDILNATFTPAAAITTTQNTIPYLTDTNAIVLSSSITGFAVTSGFTSGTAILTATGHAEAGFAGKTMTITSPDGKIIIYKFYNDTSGNSGTQDGVYTRIQLKDVANVTEVIDQIELAIGNANYGHGGRISLSQDAGVLTLTYVHQPLNEIFSAGDYLVLNTSVFNWANEEIIYIDSIDTTNNVLNVTRNVFGSLILSYSNSTEYELYSNRLTIDSRQNTTRRFIANLSNWSNYAGNHIGGNGNWINYSLNSGNKEGNGLIDSSGTNQSVVFSNSDKTITLGSGVTAPNFTEGDTITIYYGADGEDEPNNGKSFKILKIDTSGVTTILTVDTAPADDTEATDSVYIESNLIKNHTFHHASDEVNPTVEVGSDQDYKVNHWVARNYYHVPSGGTQQASNVYEDSGDKTYVTRVDSGGYWEDTTADHGADNAGRYYPFDSDDAYISIESKFNDTNVSLSSSCSIGDNFLNAGNLSKFSVNDIISLSTYDSITNGAFASDANWTKGTGWSIGSGVATATAGSASGLIQNSVNIALPVIEGVVYKLVYTLTRSAGSIQPNIAGTTGTSRSSNGTYTEYIMAGSTAIPIQFVKDASFAGTIDNVSLTTTEHMKITSMTESKLYVQRGYLNTVETAHASSTMIEKCVNPLIKQDVSKDRLKPGQPYILTFYAKDLYTSNREGYGALSVTFNGGYLNVDGDWIKPELDSNNGYYTYPENMMYEKRWIDFQDLEKSNGDTAYSADESEAESGLDTTWRKFELIINPPKNVEFLTDMSIEFASRGEDGTKIGIDLVDLSENTLIVPFSNNSDIKSVGSIDNAGKKDLVLYDAGDNKLKLSKDFNEDSLALPEVIDSIEKSPYASSSIKSKDSKASFVSKNRETHIGFGSSSEDSSPQWLGYLNHKLFGVDNSNTIYQDEDTIHSYDDAGLVTMSKVALAGEHENLDSSWSSPNLTITHTAHKMELGNNIVVREYQDIDNSWSGNGVWVVTSVSTDAFNCQRINDKDADPSGGASNNKISYRPYYYYGIKDGDSHLYRIIPDNVYTSASTASAVYTRGKIEKSLPVPYIPTSIATCYNKDTTNGIGGGRIYILTDSGEIKVINVELKYNEWSKLNTTLVSTLELEYKSYKWSNDDVSGDINGDLAVFDSLASESTPTIMPSGIISDIIETKGPTKDFNMDSTNNTDNTPSDFDTRIWVQFRPASGETFTGGDRFLFCGITNSTLTDTSNTIKLGDRTPPTNSVFPKRYRWDTANMFHCGPGIFHGGSSMASGADLGDFPLDKLWHHALYGSTRHGGSHSDGYNKEKLQAIAIRKGKDMDDLHWYQHVYAAVSSYQPNFNYGDNVGFDADGGNLASIQVVKYGLFPMGDNNCDGVIDGTGLIVPSDETLDDEISNHNIGPYGYEHEKVCAHAVGLIGGSETPWARHWGTMNGYSPTSTSGERYLKGQRAGAPENMSLEKCVFICSDVHFGDKKTANTGGTFTATTFAGVTWESAANAATKITINNTRGLQPGDTVYVDWDNTDGAYTIVKIDSATEFTVAMPYTSSAAGKVYLHTIYPFHTAWEIVDTDDSDGDGSTTDNVTSTKWHYGVAGQHYHWAYNPDEPLDGEIFTNAEDGGGHYSKTWWTPPYSNGLIGLSTTNYTNSLTGIKTSPEPGYLHRVERLNYRAGYMIRPFDLSDDTFEDLLIGNGTYIDAPVRPEAIYHVENGGTKTHDNRGGNNNNQFASKIFITTPIKDDYDNTNKSKMFICDPTFEYPDILHQEEKLQNPGSETTNSWNGTWTSYEPLIYGKIDDYIEDAVGTSTHAHRNAIKCPLIQIDPGADIVDNNSILAANSRWRESNRFAGQMITIVHADTGAMQTRYIVASDTWDGASASPGYGASDDLFVAVHHPFGVAPAANDLFYIWSHKYACTSPMRLFREKDLDFSLGLTGSQTSVLKADPILSAPIYSNNNRIGEIDGTTSLITVDTAAQHNLSTGDVIDIENTTNYSGYGPHAVTVTSPKQFTISGTFTNDALESNGDWVLVEANHSDSSAANPVEFDIKASLLKTTFGGLDMRKTRTATIDSIDDNHETVSSNVRAQLTAGANHFIDDGDTITLKNAASDTVFNGVYPVMNIDGSTGTGSDTTTLDVSHSNTDGNVTDDYNLTTNQWESLVISTTGAGKTGEIRAGLNAWDTGESTGNIIRRDNSTAANADKYLNASDTSLIIKTTSIGDETNDYFLKNNEYQYKVSLVYDGYQEGLLSTSTWSFIDTSKTRAKLSIDILLKKFSKRLTSVCIYRRDNKDSFYRLIQEISTAAGWNYDGTSYRFNVLDSGASTSSYESRTGLSEVLPSIKLKYGISAEIDGFLFVGDCSHENIKNASNQIFRSKPGMYSIFDYSIDFIQLKSKPTALINFAGRLYAFDESHIYKINQQNLAIEDIYEGVGCSGKDSIIVTEYGLFFADKNGAYIHDGSHPKKISATIEDGGESSETWGGTDNINNVSWKTVAGTSISEIPYVTFDSSISSVLFFVNYNSYDSTTSNNKSIYYCWSYNLTKQRWDLWELSDNTSLGVPFIGDKGGVFIPIDNAIYQYKGGSTKRDYTWLSKKLTMEEDSIVKVYNKVKINGLTSNLNLGGDNKESSDRLLIKTSTGDMASANVTYSESDTQNSQYKLSGSNKKGRWLQFKLEDITSPIESVGIIYRRKSTK